MKSKVLGIEGLFARSMMRSKSDLRRVDVYLCVVLDWLMEFGEEMGCYPAWPDDYVSTEALGVVFLGKQLCI